MFRALLAHPQESLHKRHSVYCMLVISVGSTRIEVFHFNPGARPPDDGNDLLKQVAVNLECINKSYYLLDAFVGCFIKILQRCSVQLSRSVKIITLS
jgi:hypothetical protein